MSDSDRERLRTSRERAERHAADMDEAAKGGPKGRYFVDPKAAGEIAEGLRDYGRILGEKERALDDSAMRDAIEVFRRNPVRFIEAVNSSGPIGDGEPLVLVGHKGRRRLPVTPNFRRELSGVELIEWPFVYPAAKYQPIQDWVRCKDGTPMVEALISLREHEARDED